MSLSFELIETVTPSDKGADVPVWPFSGQEFDIFVAALDVGDKLLLVLVELPPEVGNVVGELGNGNYMADELFGNDLPDTVGLWECKVKFFSVSHIDWESCVQENEYGLEILSKKKL